MATQRRRVRNRVCVGLPWDELCQAVHDATADDGLPILEEIVAQVAQYRAQPPPMRFDWMTDAAYAEYVADETGDHGFIEWLQGLQAGWCSLPEELPTSVLLTWRDEYRDHPCNVRRAGIDAERWASPQPFLRCEECLMAMPSFPTGGGEVCPVCGGDRVAFANLGRPVGEFLPVKKRKSVR